ncbi:MAG: hypothetical protein DRJ42_01650 [Deltaproteobacteria bacterium]|nr:MAG: hypothetical protein DRJ42_01650 [Deltaproteobacteria bacterium]
MDVQIHETETREVTCPTCGAPVALAAKSPTPCAHCGTDVALPVIHVDLYQKLMAGAGRLAQADAIWKGLPPPMPRWMVPVFVAGVVLGSFALVIGWTVLARDLFGGPGRGFALVVMGPAFVALQFGLELLAWWSPVARLEQNFSAFSDKKFPEVARCRVCGAPLAVHESAVVTRCAHCGSDNLVRRLRREAFVQAREMVERGRQQIDEAMVTLEMLRLQRRVIRWLGPAIMIPIFVILLVALWDQ